MPFKSQAQRRWMYANKPEMAKEWEDDTLWGSAVDLITDNLLSSTTAITTAPRRSQRRIRRAWRKTQRQARR